MLQRLGDHVENCLAWARDAERRAAEPSNEALRADNKRMARTWRHLASSYQFVETLERFLLDAEKAKHARPPDPPSEFKFPPRKTVFGPDAIAMLAAAYDKAIEGQPASVHEMIAKGIISLATNGERDPDRLCHGALALLIRQLPSSLADPISKTPPP